MKKINLPVFITCFYCLVATPCALSQEPAIAENAVETHAIETAAIETTAATAVAETVPADSLPADALPADTLPAIEPQQTVNYFDIWEFAIEGNTVLTTKQVQSAVYPYLGPQKSIEDIELAATELERAYKYAGFPVVYVDIPEQDVVAGVVRLKVVQGAVSRIRVADARYFTPSGIKSKLPALTKGEPLHVPSMQQELNALNAASSDLSVTPILKPGKTPGEVEIELKVKDTFPVHGSFGVNDYSSATTSSLRASASLSYANLWQKQHSASLQYQTAPENTDEVSVWVGTYLLPVGEKNRLALYTVDSDSDVASVGASSVIGKGAIYGARLVMPLPSTRQFIHTFSAGFDYKDFEEIIRLDVSETDTTPIEYALWSFNYSSIMPATASMTKWGLGLNYGLRGFVNKEDEFSFKRFGAKSNFTVFNADFDREDYFGQWTLHSYGKLQIADSALINNEQFSVGGPGSVRGYFQSQQLADDGINLGVELITPSVFAWQDYISATKLLVFAEWAELEVNNPLPEQQDYFNLSGVGLGLRVSSRLGFELSFDWAYAQKDNDDVQAGDARSHVEFNYSF